MTPHRDNNRSATNAALNAFSATCTLFAAFALLLTACNGGLRPTLVEVPTPESLPRLELDLPSAPPGTSGLEPADPSLPAESSVDDALAAWATSQGIAYLDACARTTPDPGELCDVPTERDTVRLLGPSASEIWYVVTVEELDSFDFGTSYRVVAVDLAGDY